MMKRVLVAYVKDYVVQRSANMVFCFSLGATHESFFSKAFSSNNFNLDSPPIWPPIDQVPANKMRDLRR